MISPQRVEINVGDIYWDCSYHPVLCTEVNYDDDVIEGVSLFNGSSPRSCSTQYCGVKVLNAIQVQILIQMRDDFMLAEKFYRSTQNREFYDILLTHLIEKTDFRKQSPTTTEESLP